MNHIQVCHVEVFNGQGLFLEAVQDRFFDFVSPLDVVHDSMIKSLKSSFVILFKLFSDLVDVVDGEVKDIR